MLKLILTYEKIFYFFLLQVLMKKIYPNITKLIIQFFFMKMRGEIIEYMTIIEYNSTSNSRCINQTFSFEEKFDPLYKSSTSLFVNFIVNYS